LIDPAKWKSLSDDEIIARVRMGETALYELIMRRYDQRLYRITRAILRDENEAEDVLQESYIRAYVHLDQFAGHAKFSTWLTKIAIHEALARQRQRNRIVDIVNTPDAEMQNMESLKSQSPSPEQQSLDLQARKFLEAAIDSLPERYRSVFILREIEELSTAETAACLELSEETVKVRLHRSREMLRRKLYERAGAASARAFQFLGERCDNIVHRVLERIGACA
jgi:RNA polymerase sigma-70 factor (ECF subfamily)